MQGQGAKAPGIADKAPWCAHRTPQMSKSGTTAATGAREDAQQAGSLAAGHWHYPRRRPTRPAPSIARERTAATRGEALAREGEIMSANEMLETKPNPLNESFSALCRESLFERPRELSRTPTKATNRDSRHKAENDPRRGQQAEPTAHCPLPTAYCRLPSSSLDPSQRVLLRPRQTRAGLTACRRDTREIATGAACRTAFHPPTDGSNLDLKVRPVGVRRDCRQGRK